MVRAARIAVAAGALAMSVSASGCSAKAPVVVEARDEGANASASAGEKADEGLAVYLRRSVPSGGAVEGDKVTHTVGAGDTYASLAAAYLELTEI